MSNTTKKLTEAIKAASKPATKGYDTSAVVRRIEGNTAWVHIPGGVDETPVKLTIAAEPGDAVQVRVSGGSAWIVGNATAPPTDNKMAFAAAEKAEKASKTASDYITGDGSEIQIHAKNNPDRDYTQINSEGMQVFKGGEKIASFGASGGQIGKDSASHSVIDASGQRFYGSDGVTQLANIGYGEGQAETGTSEKPYYTFGTRESNTIADRGNYSVAEGQSVIAKGWASHAEGFNTEANGKASHAEGHSTVANGNYSHASGQGTVAYSSYQTVIGRYNKNSGVSPEGYPYTFIIGNGNVVTEQRSNALTVDSNGAVAIGSPGATFVQTAHVVRAQGTSIPSYGYESGAVTVTNPGYYPIAIAGWESSSRYYSLGRAYLTDQANDTAKINYLVYNAHTSAHDSEMKVYVLWMRRTY